MKSAKENNTGIALISAFGAAANNSIWFSNLFIKQAILFVRKLVENDQPSVFIFRNRQQV